VIDQVAIRVMTAEDVPTAAAIHAHTLLDPWGRMGPRFLRTFYGEMIRLKEIALVATTGSAVIGFAVGSVRPGQLFAAVLRHRLIPLGLAAVPTLGRQPGMLPRFVRGLMKPADAHRPEGTATLLFIAVSEHAQHRGIGRLLVRSLLAEAMARGATRVDLQTDRLSNDAANAFYRSLGFRQTGALAAGKRLVNTYELDLRQPAGGMVSVADVADHSEQSDH